jgi:hypothetical protein
VFEWNFNGALSFRFFLSQEFSGRFIHYDKLIDQKSKAGIFQTFALLVIADL